MSSTGSRPSRPTSWIEDSSPSFHYTPERPTKARNGFRRAFVFYRVKIAFQPAKQAFRDVYINAEIRSARAIHGAETIEVNRKFGYHEALFFYGRIVSALKKKASRSAACFGGAGARLPVTFLVIVRKQGCFRKPATVQRARGRYRPSFPLRIPSLKHDYTDPLRRFGNPALADLPPATPQTVLSPL